MLQIFADLSAMQEGILRIGGSDYNHIRNVLRMRPGDRLVVRSGQEPDQEAFSAAGPQSGQEPDQEAFSAASPQSGQEPDQEAFSAAGPQSGQEPGSAASDGSAGSSADSATSSEYCFEIVSFDDDQVVCRLHSVRSTVAELPVKVLLFQGLPKSDKMDFIVQKAVEMGVSEVIPVEMHRSIVKLAGGKRQKRVERWQSIAEAAAKQSRRAYIPQVHEILSMEEAVRYAVQAADLVFVPYERMAEEAETGTRARLEALQSGQTAAVFVGPEGGFEESEVDAVLKAGGHTISLGRRILRTETAALAFLAFLIYRFEL